ncbi:arginyl-tRNA synthetase [Solidesulfovibrio carbinoliphilus subsp. oakridgensis]|uniref:Arginine--tRNA ligase n=1 Tax=Solidesulfovibrio carbinoliphilus subsp. oakridgensis TaxID=694327 RepID=G7Q5V8_9BACT|nr:arginine--tRNA ligase [Solidesulfovibrio carbinoliphilus]EHJ46895.1 arginyl-tRNA synthetase [Solidesulfovibrio carbinoliphilus subsp. oakridgensis]
MRATSHLRGLLETVLRESDIPWPAKTTIEPPRDKAHGDLATNVALVAAKDAKMPPRALAEHLRQALLAADTGLAEVSVAGPGFLNVTFAPAFWQQTVLDVLEQGDRYGLLDIGQGTKIQVEFVSANPTGPLHIGHGRGAAVGDCLARVLRAAGFTVETEYYINDAGRQMRILGLSILYRYRELLGEPVTEPEDYYRGDYVKDLAGQLIDREGRGLLALSEEAATDACRLHGEKEILAGIRKDLQDFRVHHDVWFPESKLLAAGAVERTFDDLRAKNLAYDKDGAFWFATTTFGDDKDRVLVKSGGELTYFASDIAYHDDKFHRGFDVVVDIWGADHHGYVPRMKACVAALGRDPEASLKVILVQLVNLLKGGEQIAMSTRAGKFETLADVVAEVGADAARFMFLSRKSDSHLDFDLDAVTKKSMDNPVYYVQYAHARVRSVFAKAAERGLVPDAASPALLARLDTAEDLELLKLLEQYPDTVAAAARSFAPHLVSFYLRELAGKLHRYYTVNQVLGAGDEAVTAARMRLLQAVALVVKNGLGLLGVSAPDKM